MAEDVYTKILPYSPWVIPVLAIPIILAIIIQDLTSGRKKRALVPGLGIVLIILIPFLLPSLLKTSAFGVIKGEPGEPIYVRTFLWAHLFTTGFHVQAVAWAVISFLSYAHLNIRLGRISLFICLVCILVSLSIVSSGIPHHVIHREMWQDRMRATMEYRSGSEADPVYD